MAAGKEADFLVEIGTEELPPKALRKLMQAFAANLDRLLNEQRLAHGDIKAWASPRRIAALVSKLAIAQDDREVDAAALTMRLLFMKFPPHAAIALAVTQFCGNQRILFPDEATYFA